jgi:membrane associated rhomboid family serine protease
MGESDRYQEYRVKKQRFTLGQDGNALMWLFIINVVFFLVLQVIQVAYFFYQKTAELYYVQVVQWFQLPASITKLSERPWAIFTYMFSDISVFRALSNMLWLWAFGSILQGIAGNKKLIPIYLYGGFVGALFFILANNLIPPLHQQVGVSNLFGANAAVIAVAVASSMLAPGYRFFRMLNGGISIWVLTIIYLLIDFAGVATESAAYSLSHLGGALAGFLFVIFLRHGKDGSVWMNNFYDWFINLFNPDKKNKKVSVKEKVFYNTGKRDPYSKTSNVTQQRVDEILDKINQRGYKSLTDDEKNILKRAAEE